ncbi:MAG TPA: M1 family metallopeptidase [Flavisolibacter sp.]|nr:M1 family metallopeptidase [Flavisolibacter sp.]
MQTLFCFLLILMFSTDLGAQSLYMPRDVRKAFKNRTRSDDGSPGPRYWQNHARYNISIKALPPSRTVEGTESISYMNESPDSLRNLVFKLILNIHKPGAPRLGGAGADYLTSGVHIDSFYVNGAARPWNNNRGYYTSVPVRLPRPLAPHDSVQLRIRWHYDVSLQSNREGMIDSTTYYLAYFYPRVAVYDDYQGWDFTAFNDALEFYNDFNDYTVSVEVPRHYLVWGTGTLLDPRSVLQPSFADKFQRSLTADTVVHVVTKADLATRNVTAQGGTNTWQFSARNVPDVAFGLSDHFVWDASSVMVDDAALRRASVQSAYNDTANDFHHMVGFGQQALDWLSHVWPGIPYPYEKTTIFQGYAGMEYPMMANDETYEDTTFARFVAMHELAHTYMPFYMGINETRYGFMDEGWATTFELLFNRDKMKKEEADNFYKQFRVTGWVNDPSPDEDLPIITPGANLNGGGLGNNEYGKPSLGYLAVKDMLGDDLFRKCLHEYMRRWNGKHPLPWDFFNSFNAAAGKSLDWFWNNWFFSQYYIDLAVKNVKKMATGYSVTIQNIGGMASPFDLVITYADGHSERLHSTASVWQTNQKIITLKIPAKKAAASIAIDGGVYMDADEANNVWKNSFGN